MNVTRGPEKWLNKRRLFVILALSGVMAVSPLARRLARSWVFWVVLVPVLLTGVITRLMARGRASGAGQIPADEPPALQQLRRRLLEHESEPRARPHVARALSQLGAVQRYFKAFDAVVSARFPVGELTHTRYQESGHRVYTTVLDNLESVALTVVAAHFGDWDRLMREAPGSEPGAARGAGEDRLESFRKCADRIGKLLEANEQALTSLVAVTTAIDGMGEKSPAAQARLDALLSDMRDLEARARLYAEADSTGRR